MNDNADKITGVYYDKACQRQTEETSIAGMRLLLSPSQQATLRSLLDFAQQAPASSVVPAYISAETGSGKTEVALRLAVLVMQEISSRLRQLHAVYLSPTRKLAREVSERLNFMVSNEMPHVRMVSISGQDEDKVDRVRDVFSVFQSQQNVFLATNIQFLASLATKTAAFYRLPTRAGQFQLAASLSEANVVIVDEPHFYAGKAFIRLLGLLLAILEHKQASGGINPTLLLFISATMNVPEIEKLLRYHMTQCGLGLAPVVDDADWPLERRWLQIVEADHGEKWSVFETGENIGQVFNRIAGIVKGSKSCTVVYWDSVPMLVKLQQFLKSQNYEAAVWHSQMPRDLQISNLQRLADGKARVVLVTSAAEVGVEFERWGILSVDRIVSVNTATASKALQRWGRLARRSNATGAAYFVDLAGRPKSLADRMTNGIGVFDPKKKVYPSFVSKVTEFEAEFSTAYCSPVADQRFAQAVKKAIARVTGAVLPIYLSSSISVRDVGGNEEISIPLGKLSAGAMEIQADAWLEFSNQAGDFLFSLRRGRLAWRPKSLLVGNVRLSELRGTLRSRVLPEWATRASITRAELWDGEVSLSLPNMAAGFRFCSELIGLRFPPGLEVGPGFRSSEECELLLEACGLASCDLDVIAQRKSEENADIVFLYEPGRREQQDLSVGAIEYVWRDVLRGNYP